MLESYIGNYNKYIGTRTEACCLTLKRIVDIVELLNKYIST